ncbi:glycosyltransferase [Commensalibacter communis]|uniref:glycosyltransferase n=1 Tax=Commensalibacter communis TaxID=2972786 RepID=UPI0022FFAFE9|nr:glycosyltransferase [Commensalibacter communis]CAI3946067.1 Glycosyltransferase involved in cell wall bisynthesis (RfaB) (PDB:2IV7) [Commensalibacter communis]CAI3946257.1 Glycosyltransferase involved in cell wall bisynthesis (RfaB) (PDB:2IV7) [Commensalibacter communis]
MVKKDILTPKWEKFDNEWYRQRYSSILPIIEDIYAGDVYLYYQEKGRKIGHSPNSYFDEKWYLKTYPIVAEAVQSNQFLSGFDHYCREGYKDHSPHWLFTEDYYQEQYNELTNHFAGYKNGYDHYLNEGDLNLFSGSIFFNPLLYALQQDNQELISVAGGSYQHFSRNLTSNIGKTRLSWFFDEEWYVNTYPDVQNSIKRHEYSCGLHHYLSNPTPLEFSPSADFSESFYRQHYNDVASSVGVGHPLRNGYMHFIFHGYKEGRRPNENFELDQLALQGDVIKAISSHMFHNAFEYWVAKQDQVLFDQYCNEFKSKIQTEDLTAAQLPLSNETNVVHETASQVVSKSVEDSDATDEVIHSLGTDPIPTIAKDPIIDEDEDFPVLTVDEDKSLLTIEPQKEKIKFTEYSKISDAVNEDEDSNVLSEMDPKKDPQPSPVPSPNKAFWKDFDEEWYVRKYSDVTSEIKALDLDSVEEYYHSFGCHKGHSPNPYFDEQWYLKTYPEVKSQIEQHQYVSGFEHYCHQGYQKYSPHWLFSEAYYRQKLTHLTDENLARNGFVNGYDHYLRAGDREGISGSVFFAPEFFIGHYNSPIQSGLGAYSHYLKHIDTISNLTRTSWYFDPAWYLQQYPDVQTLIDNGEFINPLHHYLTNDDPKNYSPLLWFNEQFYNSEYADLFEQLEPEQNYRNGYAHFIDKGIGLLLQPSLPINLDIYSFKTEVKRDINNGLYPNAYVHWLANHADIHDVADLKEDETEYYTHISDILADENAYQGAVWAQFDEEWYLMTYSDVPQKMEICGIESVKEYYEQIGVFLGHSPNPYFDEQWYLFEYEFVKKDIKRGKFKTGFDHYCRIGHKKCQPHWLFSSEHYLYHNPNFTYEINASSEYVNAYDHYLKKGDALRKTGSLFFDPLVYERHCYEAGNVEKTYFPFRNYLLNMGKTDLRATVSLYFDSRWYLDRYPEVLHEIKAGKYTSALQHYFMNPTPTSYEPLPWFSEKFYVEEYPDLAGVISTDRNSKFRNGYEHFLLHGSLECRNPHPDVNLKKYYLSGSVRDDIENGFYRDAFGHWVFDKRLEAWIDHLPEDSHYRLSDKTVQSREYFQKKAHFMLPTVAHQKLDFSYEGKPDISVIMLVKNQLAVTLTALASLRANFKGKIQLLIGDNHSTDDTIFIQNCLIGAHLTRFAYNFGYGRACNYLIEQVKAPITVFLNNDIYLYPGAIDILCKHLVSKTDIAAVGGKIIHPDGHLQEAGSIIWRDGTTIGYLRGDDPLIPEANFVRNVDYCSTAMMAIKTSILLQLEGFSSIYYPAYFEDTDLCVRIIKAGYRVVYHPDAVVEHMEYASSDPIVSSGLTRRNHQKFVKAHADFLRFQHPRHSDNVVIARERTEKNKRILFIEDRVPLRNLGSGYVRSNDIVRQMAKLGYSVTVYPINDQYPHLFQIYSDLPETVEVLYNRTIHELSEFFFKRAGYYDVIWIGRTHNLQRILPMMGEANRYIPQDCLILDTEVIATPRTLLRQDILGLKKDEEDTLEIGLERELSCARHCQTMVTVNEIDANYAKATGFDQVSILGHMLDVRPTPKTWEERTGLLFVGALHDSLSPNFDSLEWFLSEVFPIVVKKMDQEFTFTIAGYVHPSVDMSVFAKYPQVKLLGAVDDLTYLYNDNRVCIAPTRFAGGIPYKLHEAASFGIPIVATELLVRQLGWTDDKDIFAASIYNPEFFASQIVRLYQEEKLWNKLRNNALSRIDKECNEQQFRDNLQQILTQVTSHK